MTELNGAASKTYT